MDLEKIKTLVKERKAAINDAYDEIRRKAEEYTEKMFQLLSFKKGDYVVINDDGRSTYIKVDSIIIGHDYLTFWGYMFVSSPSKFVDSYHNVQYGASTYEFNLFSIDPERLQNLKAITEEEFDAAFKEMLIQMWEYHNGCKGKINHEDLQES